jgi:HEAT repeat protein
MNGAAEFYLWVCKRMKTIILTTLTLASITAIFAVEQLSSRQPRYRDKQLTAWLNDLNSQEPLMWDQAETAVRAIGSKALPVLAKRLDARDSSFKLKLIEFFEDYPVVILKPAESYHDAALECCRILGPITARLVPQIIPFLERNQRTHAVKALVAVGDSAVQPLVAALAHQPARAGAAVALGSIARQPRIAVPALVPYLNDNDPETRTTVAWALGRFGADARLAVSQLSKLTKDSTFSVREQAKRALERITSPNIRFNESD